ncbi:EF hand family protein [Nesidiocoris tenuis]|uniref:EF hand family protein n=1 Tax=Nesidiocoris tenuis TaxID=355587 RepID=A0ABN7AV57_9HEMI|nr:EF hand family protein [Nesidiocoris tenuis]
MEFRRARVKNGPPLCELPGFCAFLCSPGTGIEREKRLNPVGGGSRSERRGTVCEKMFEIAMMRMGLFFSRTEMGIIQSKYGDNGSINYEKLTGDLELHTDQSQMDQWFESEKERERSEEEEKRKEQLRRESNIVEICAKIKKSLICSKIKTADLFSANDSSNTGLIPWDVFKASCHEAKLDLTERELDMIRHVFQSPNDAGHIEYKLFSRVVDEPSVKSCLERLPLKTEMQQRRMPKPPLEHDFVNFEDRVHISQAMKILCKRITLGHIEMFKELDKEDRGIVNRTQFLQILYKTGVLHLLTLRQIEALMKGFGYEESQGYVINYSAWLNALDIVFCTEKAAAKL